jgi:TyrR family helix-turn-helix protein
MDTIVSESDRMQQVMHMAHTFAQKDVSHILVTGDSGTGKRVVAHFIHHNGPRREKPLVEINCAALPENLLEAELFGYEPGAFTGAVEGGKPGMFELAQGGTLFLDEIGELSHGAQAKLLKCMEEDQIMRLGGVHPITIHCNIITATNRNLISLCRKKAFREDLFHRLNGFNIHIPPLKKRPEDIVALAQLFLEKYNERYRTQKILCPRSMEVLSRHPFPGNVRELNNLIKKGVVLAREESLKDFFEQHLTKEEAVPEDNHVTLKDWESVSLKEKLDQVEKQILILARRKLGTTRKMAHKLGLSQSGVARKLQKYQIP